MSFLFDEESAVSTAERMPARTGPDDGNARLPQSYEAAKTALSACVSLDECQDWADKAAALASYAKQANDDELMRMATRIRDRAIRRAGELLKQIEPKQGANQNIGADALPKVETRKEVAASAGMSPHQAKQAIRVANVPAAQFEKLVESPTPPTVTKLAAMGTQSAPKPVLDLKGRDPEEFNLAMHYVGGWRDAARDLASLKHDQALPILIPSEIESLRAIISQVDAITDRIVTRI